jgi:hypothetical protein
MGQARARSNHDMPADHAEWADLNIFANLCLWIDNRKW